MKRQCMKAAILVISSLMVLNSCKHDKDDYEKKPYTVTDNDRVSYAEKTFGITIDKLQDWVLTNETTTTI